MTIGSFRSAQARAVIVLAAFSCLLAAVTRLDASDDRAEADFSKVVKPFLAKYCISCHGAEEQEGDQRFDRLAADLHREADANRFQSMADKLRQKEMPPEDAPQPSESERDRVHRWLADQATLFLSRADGRRPTTVLRRLNRREYRNTVHDLLKVDVTMFDPAQGFPRERLVDHLDNDGQALVTSGYLLQRYLESAERLVHKAIYPIRKPRAKTWTFRRGFRQQPEIDQVHRRTNGFSHLTLYEVTGADKLEGAYAPILAFQQGVPQDGYYKIRFRAEAVNRVNPYDPTFLGVDPNEPLRLGIVPGNIRAGRLHKPQPIEPLQAEIDLADEPKWYTVRVWLDAGYSPRFTFRNGLMDVRSLWSRILRKYPDEFPNPRVKGIVARRYQAIKFGKLPQIHIHEIEIEGPLYDGWPRPSQRAVLGEMWETARDGGEPTLGQMRRQLAIFASRAYRRPVRSDELDRLVGLIETRRRSGKSSWEAYGDALKAVLCSPSFLYLDEPEEKGRLTPYALASRLSYFLWSSMPDETLRRLARTGSLQDPAILKQQIPRMLEDPKSEAFIDGFLDSWLTLRDLGSMPPDRRKFREYYHYDLKTAMRRETQLFTRHLLDRNLSIGLFLDSDFTFVNKPLARLYRLKPPAEPGFHRVSLPDGRRGGLLGQASVLTVTANGIDTSPVVRGVWLLENLLGTPPSPRRRMWNRSTRISAAPARSASSWRSTAARQVACHAIEASIRSASRWKRTIRSVAGARCTVRESVSMRRASFPAARRSTGSRASSRSFRSAKMSLPRRWRPGCWPMQRDAKWGLAIEPPSIGSLPASPREVIASGTWSWRSR